MQLIAVAAFLIFCGATNPDAEAHEAIIGAGKNIFRAAASLYKPVSWGKCKLAHRCESGREAASKRPKS